LTPYISENIIATSNPLTLVKRNPMKKIPSKSDEKLKIYTSWKSTVFDPFDPLFLQKWLPIAKLH
jgi:hypothetical protein